MPSGSEKQQFARHTITIHVPKASIFMPVSLLAKSASRASLAIRMSNSTWVNSLSMSSTQGYCHVDASVYAGEVDAEAFGDNNGGLFRSSSKTAEGPYHLHAHVGSGQLALR
jgi:hypothetical protein